MPLLTLKILPAGLFVLCCWLIDRLWPRRPALMLLMGSTAARCLFYEAGMWRTATAATRIAAGLMMLAVIESLLCTLWGSHGQGAVMTFSLGVGLLMGGVSLAVGFAEEPYRCALQIWGFTALIVCLLVVMLTWWEGYELQQVWMQACLALYIGAAIVSSRREHSSEWWSNTLVTEALQIVALWAMISGVSRPRVLSRPRFETNS